MLSNKWLIAGFAAAAVSTVSIYALLHKDEPTAQVAAVTWDQVYVAETAYDDPAPMQETTPAALPALPGSAAPAAAPYPETTIVAVTTLDQAVQGALAGDLVGLHDLQNYFDAALGDEVELSRRARAVLQALGRTSLGANHAAMSDAAARVSEAVGRALASAYQLPLETADNLALPGDAQGWDFGPEEVAPAHKFRRVSNNSPEVAGRALRAVGGAEGPQLLSDGLTGVDKFSTALPDGYYRLVLLSAENPAAGVGNAPFGNQIRSNGRPLRMVDGARVVPGAAARLDGTRVTVLSPAMPGQDDDALVAMLSAGNGGPVTRSVTAAGDRPGQLLSLRALVSDGNLTLEFAANEGEETYLVALMAENSNPGQLENDIENDIAALLSNTRTAAGGDDIGTPVPGGQWAFASGAGAPSAMTGGRGTPRGGAGGGFGGGAGGGYGGGGSGGSGGGDSGGGNPGGTGPGDPGGNPDGNPGGNPGGGNPGGENPGGGNPGGENPGGGNPGGNPGNPDDGNPGGGPDDGNPGGNPDDGNPGGGNPGDGDNNPTPPAPRLTAKTDGDKAGRLGQVFTFDGCASLLNDDELCGFTEDYLEENFEITWWLDGEKIGEGFLLETTTGEHTLFDRIGDYVLTLEITYLLNDLPLWSSDSARLSLTPAAVAAPAGGGLLLLGLGALMARRRNRR